MDAKIIIFYLTKDLLQVKNLQDRCKNFQIEIQFIPIPDGQNLTDTVKKYTPDIIIIDEASLDPFNKPLREKVFPCLSATAKTDIPFFLVSSDRTITDIKKIIDTGFTDIFLKPLDPALFFQKLQIYMPKKRFLKDNLLFNMKVDSQVDIALPTKLVSASEYGLTILLNKEIKQHELFYIYGSVCGESSGQCLCRVLSCHSVENQSFKYEAMLSFIGLKKEFLSSIRVWIKQEYIKMREASS